MSVKLTLLIATLLLVTACAAKQVDPLLIPPEADAEANGTS